MNLYVIAGHGAGDPGACANGATEAQRVRALAARVKELGGAAVTLHDPNDNAYASGALERLSVPSGTGVVELHMDSAAPGARGAHVIVKAGMRPDAVDRALADGLAAIFPGRSQTIVGRSDLANPNRAARRGINYRLLECGFITSPEDLATFDARLDDVARAILAAFGAQASGATQTAPAPQAAPAPQHPGPVGQELLLDCDAGRRTWAELALQLGLGGSDADGWLNYQYRGNARYLRNVSSALWKWYRGCPGSATVKALQRRIGSANVDGVLGKADVCNLQSYMNRTWGYHMLVDGDFGPKVAYNLQHSLNLGLWRE